MFRFIKFEYKRLLKSSLTWFFIIAMVLCNLFYYQMVSEQQRLRTFKGHVVYPRYDSVAEIYEDGLSKDTLSYRSLKMIDDAIQEGHYLNQGKEYHELMSNHAFMYVLAAKRSFYMFDDVSNYLFQKEVQELWNTVSDGVAFEEVDFRPYISTSGFGYTFLNYAKIYHQHYIAESLPVYKDDIDPINVLFSYFFKDGYMLLVLIVLVVIGARGISTQYIDGTLKSLLTSNLSRMEYYVGKWISSVLYAMTVASIVPALAFVWLVLGKGFHYLSYPILLPDHLWSKALVAGGTVVNYHPMIGGGVLVSDRIMPSYLQVQSICTYVLYSMIILLAFACFIIALCQLISATIKNDMFTLLVSISLIGIGMIAGQVPELAGANDFNPFLYYKPGVIVSGLTRVTALSSVGILLIGTVMFVVAGCMYFSKKEI